MTPLQMIAEWRKGCSNTGAAGYCETCTVALVHQLEKKLKDIEQETKGSAAGCTYEESKQIIVVLDHVQNTAIRNVIDDKMRQDGVLITSIKPGWEMHRVNPLGAPSRILGILGRIAIRGVRT